MSVIKVDVGNEFYHRLANRDNRQGDGKHTAIEFRDNFLKELYIEDAWKDDNNYIELDFSNVNKLGPSFANEAFAYFTRFKNASPTRILKKIKFTNISKVKMMIIANELESGYK